MSLQKKINNYIPGHKCLTYVRQAQAVDESCIVEYHFLYTPAMVIRKPLKMDFTDVDILNSIRDVGKEYAELAKKAQHEQSPS